MRKRDYLGLFDRLDADEPNYDDIQPNIACGRCGEEFLTPRELRQHEVQEHGRDSGTRID
jgi:hypothetical protein